MTKRDQIYLIGETKYVIDLAKRGLKCCARDQLQELRGVIAYLGRTNQITKEEREKLFELWLKLSIKHEI